MEKFRFGETASELVARDIITDYCLTQDLAPVHLYTKLVNNLPDNTLKAAFLSYQPTEDLRKIDISGSDEVRREKIILMVWTENKFYQSARQLYRPRSLLNINLLNKEMKLQSHPVILTLPILNKTTSLGRKSGSLYNWSQPKRGFTKWMSWHGLST
ncbi:hypothetical protein CYY_009081 [Polysphondylium violaceum]|uniref:Uncharacterized protein n=1 Tax=Polysphondylium violaceum TaxID=133409 RepID=A0A8J4UWE5_9MYCE|nr:hypothetical protein CYY_009081 [Polysphondylium violaceum]